MTEKVRKSEAEWRKILTPQQYHVTRQKGTEPPGTGEYEDMEDPGIYVCVCCGQPLFSSETKFHSGSGWPSFYAPVDERKSRNRPRHQPRDDARGSALQPMRRAPRPRLSRRPAPDGPALLHQFGFTQIGREGQIMPIDAANPYSLSNRMSQHSLLRQATRSGIFVVLFLSL